MVSSATGSWHVLPPGTSKGELSLLWMFFLHRSFKQFKRIGTGISWRFGCESSSNAYGRGTFITTPVRKRHAALFLYVEILHWLLAVNVIGELLWFLAFFRSWDPVTFKLSKGAVSDYIWHQKGTWGLLTSQREQMSSRALLREGGEGSKLPDKEELNRKVSGKTMKL